MYDVTCLVAALVLSASSSVQDKPAAPSAAPEDAFVRLERAVPADAIFFAAARDLHAVREDLEKNSWYGFLREPAMRAWIERGLASSDLPDFKDLPVDPFAILGSIHGGAVAFLQWENGAEEPSTGGLLVQPGEERDAFDAELDRVLELARAEGGASTESYGGIDLQLFESHKTVAVVFDLPDMAGVVIGEGREKVLPAAHGVLDRYRGTDATEGLATSSLLSEARASAAFRPRVEMLIDLAQVFAMPDAQPDTDEERLAAGLVGYTDLRWAYIGANAGSGEALDIVCAVDMPSRGILRILGDALGSF